MFKSAKENFRIEQDHRKQLNQNRLFFGVSYLDKGSLGIRPNDLILLGAYSGAGKSQLCVNIAQTNLKIGKKIHFIALEDECFEIERRLKYQMLAKCYFDDKERNTSEGEIRYDKWLNGYLENSFEKYMEQVNITCENYYGNLLTFYKDKNFGVNELIENVTKVVDETSMVVIDHVHYFDWDDDDNKAIKQIAKTVRTLVLEFSKPIILVSHLRKRDRNSKELCPGLDEFHGSSDLFKIATKVVTMCGGNPDGNGYATYFRMPKNRNNGSVTRFVGKVIFDVRRNCYEEDFKVGWANDSKFGELAPDLKPDWAK